MKCFVKSVFMGAFVASTVLPKGHTIPKLSPRLQQLAAEYIKELHHNFNNCVARRYKLSVEELRQDIDIFWDILSNEFAFALTKGLKMSMNRCDNPSAGLREKIAPFEHLENAEYLSTLFYSVFFERKKSVFPKTEKLKVLNLIEKLREFCLWDRDPGKGFTIEENIKNIKELQKNRFLVGHRGELKCDTSCMLIGTFWNETFDDNLIEKLREFCLLDRNKGFTIEENIKELQKNRFLVGHRGELECDTSCMLIGTFWNEIYDDIYMQCYAEALNQSSPKVRIYHRMFLFFDKDIPESDAALFYGEETFRASLRYERIKADIENKTIDAKTHFLIDRFYRLASEMLTSRDRMMVRIATAGLKKDFFNRFPYVRYSDDRLPNELKQKIKKAVAFIDRMRKMLENMRDDLNTLREQTYRDADWWKIDPKINEKEGKKILEEIE